MYAYETHSPPWQVPVISYNSGLIRFIIVVPDRRDAAGQQQAPRTTTAPASSARYQCFGFQIGQQAHQILQSKQEALVGAQRAPAYLPRA